MVSCTIMSGSQERPVPMPDVGEANLLEAIVQRKDREAFAELFRRFETPAFRRW